MYPDIFENASFYPFGLASTRTAFSVTKNEAFRKRPFHIVVWTGENGAFRQR